MIYNICKWGAKRIITVNVNAILFAHHYILCGYLVIKVAGKQAFLIQIFIIYKYTPVWKNGDYLIVAETFEKTCQA